MLNKVLFILILLVGLLYIVTDCSLKLIKTDLDHPPAGVSIFGK